MVFTTYHFLFMFLPLVLGIYYTMHSRGLLSLRTVFLTLASYVFYAWDRPGFAALILTSTLIDYFCGHIVAQPDHPRRTQLLGKIQRAATDAQDP